MEEYKKRVIEERQELNIKIKALQKFIEGNKNCKDLNLFEKRDLKKQLTAMFKYSSILKSRINRF